MCGPHERSIVTPLWASVVRWTRGNWLGSQPSAEDAPEKPRLFMGRGVSLIADDQASGPLARAAPQQDGSEVAITRAKVKDGAPFDMGDSREHALVEHITLEGAAVMASNAMPLFGDAIVVGNASYGCSPPVSGAR